MAEIKLVMLKTGEQLIGDTRICLNDVVVIKNPLLIVPVDQQKFGFINYLDIAEEDEVSLKNSDIRAILTPKEDIRNYWDQHFGAGIITPQQTLITG